jgi:hypothetical protein
MAAHKLRACKQILKFMFGKISAERPFTTFVNMPYGTESDDHAALWRILSAGGAGYSAHGGRYAKITAADNGRKLQI